MKLVTSLLSALLLFYFVTGCSDPKYLPNDGAPTTGPESLTGYDCSLKFQRFDLCLSYTWQKTPTSEEVGEMTIRIYERDPVDGFPLLKDVPNSLFVKLWMPDMGHGSSPVTVTHVSSGTYKASNVFFSMPGAWWIQVQVREGSVVNDEIRIDYNH